MYKHHEESLQNLIAYFSDRDEVIALIFGGSVAKGAERPDSDLDAMVIVTQEFYNEKKEKRQLAETIHGHSTYEGGYFDLKYYTKEIFRAAAEKGSEPARNAYVGARLLFSKDDEIAGILEKIPVFQRAEKEEKLLVFYGGLWLNYHYFLGIENLGRYMRVRTATEIVYCCYRLILQDKEVLFPCNRQLEEFVLKSPGKPEQIVALAGRFLEKMDDDSAKAFVDATLDWISFQPPEDSSVMLTKYVEYYELWWQSPRPFVNEW